MPRTVSNTLSLKDRFQALIANAHEKGFSPTVKDAVKWRWFALVKGFQQRPIRGRPYGLARQRLEEVCAENIGEALLKSSYVHLSGWKTSGSYRVYLHTKNQRRFSIIYKNAVYNIDEIPALSTFPLLPGPPEHVVYSQPPGPLAEFLPEVYSCKMVRPQKQYQYLLEDLGKSYVIPYTDEDILRIVARLPELHDVLAQWAQQSRTSGLLRYDPDFLHALQPYIRHNLTDYFTGRAYGEIITEIRARWSGIMKLYGDPNFFDSSLLCTIHGDLNITNVLLHTSNPKRMKFLDWEWMGRGLPHAELASLLKDRSQELVQQALIVYAARNQNISRAEHERLYYWSQLVRGLLDAAFFAAQIRQSTIRVQRLREPAITRSLKNVLQMYHTLNAKENGKT